MKRTIDSIKDNEVIWCKIKDEFTEMCYLLNDNNFTLVSNKSYITYLKNDLYYQEYLEKKGGICINVINKTIDDYTYYQTDDTQKDKIIIQATEFLEDQLITSFTTRGKTILEEAQSLIYGDRAKDYGSATKNFTDIAKGWEVITGASITPEQVALMMSWLKICRVNKDNCEKKDSYVDLAGYAGCIEKIKKGL